MAGDAFRKPRLGDLPHDWQVMRLSELTARGPQNGLYKERGFYGRGWEMVHMPEMFSGKVITTGGMQRVDVTDSEVSRFRLEKDDLLFARRSVAVAGSGKCSIVGRLAEVTTFESSVIRMSLKKDVASPLYVYHYIQSPPGRRQMMSITRHLTISGITGEDLNEYLVPLPPLGEQYKIAEVFEHWDNAIEKIEDLVVAQQQERKRGLMQQLLTGRMRFKEFEDGQWRSLALGEILNFEPRVVTKPKGAFLAAGIRSHGKGVFLKPDFEADDIALDELFQLRTDDFVLNITFAWEGAAAIVPPEADGALVSHRFPTFTFKRGVSFPGYFRHVIRQKRFVHELGLVSPGGAGRNRVLSKSDFLHIRVELPSFEEQQRIAAVLDASDREIELLQKQLGALKEQKRGLMHKLLTGEVRVKVKG